ncbi:hypothetical protein Anas_05678 [Armadillidium nasatum]|uniref:Ubiquitin carboxyl-terminal hydrolase MINDY n=1 Tax=Armadillidium nasatum TaxID=96803 RepID=A0A5N5TL97_9CRUS|nr:hypothetical protein Anas_05678 [Armadillidium nasatum]
MMKPHLGVLKLGEYFESRLYLPLHYHVRETFPFHPLQTIGEGRGPPKKRTPSEDFLNDFNTRDIMAQSMKRHSLRGSKFNPLDIRNEDPYNRIKLGIKSPSNFTVFQPDAKSYQGSDRGNDRQTPFVTEIPSNHDDVQILNLQGFMDSDMRGQTAAPRAKSRRSNVRRLEDSSPIDSTRRTGRPRRKKKSKQLNKGIGNGLDETDEVVLKDIDDLDEKMASLVAHLLKSLIFGSRVSPDTSPASPLRPSTREWSWALSAALAEILWRISQSQKVVLTLLIPYVAPHRPGSLSSHFDHTIGRYTPDGLTETLNIYEFTTSDSLFIAVENHLQVFTTNASSGCVLLLYSAILTRGLDNESHYSVAFARDQNIARDEPLQDSFDIYYYDGLALQEDEIRLTIDVSKEPKNAENVPPLELCLRTKWPNAHISWNGTEPIL